MTSEQATLAGGCFWCTEAIYNNVAGVSKVESGYTGGDVADPDYRSVCSGTTGHAEAVRLTYNPAEIGYGDLLDIFFATHDPTQLNRQGNDVGTQYRSAIFYEGDEQKKIAEASKKAAQANFDKPIVTEITKAETFYPAENYHQEFYFQNKTKNGYCKYIIEPKLKKLKLDH